MNQAQTPPIAPGQIIGERYRVGQLLGKGGMGIVCEATHVGLEVPVAIKFIRTDLKDNSEFVQRFLNEARRAAALKNEHVARVHDVGQLESGDLYLVMERLEGVGLDAYVRERGPLRQAEAVNLILQACEGLSEAHSVGVVHRDIKPENLFLARRSDGKRTLKILDFGISKQTADDAPSSLTNSERSLGSPWYMSPEQMIDTSSVDHRADIWSLGVVLFELLTGSRPFDGTSIPEICAGVLTVPAPALRQRRPEIDPVLEAIVERCLAKNPDGRPASVLALSADLKPFTSSSEGAAETIQSDAEKAFFSRGNNADDRPTPTSVVPPTPRSSPRRTLARGLGVLGILSTLTLAIWAFRGARSKTEELQPPPDPVLARNTPDAALDQNDKSDPLPSAQSVTVVPVPGTEGKAPQPGDTTDGANEANETSSTTRETPHAAPRPSQIAGEARKPRTGAAPVLTQEEIRRRKEQYDRWLREQGLQRLDEVVVPSASEAPRDQSGESP